MTKTKTDDALKIFLRGREVPGILVYGYWPLGRKDCPAFPRNIWPPSNEFSNFKLVATNDLLWTVWMWNLAIPNWPSQSIWKNQINDTLKVMIAAGASVAWCGVEGLFADPPALFNPKEMSGGVWAYLLRDGEFICKGELGQIFDVLSDTEMASLRDRF